MVVTAQYTTGTEIISGYTASPASGDILSTDDNKVVISYTYKGITKTASFAINVEPDTVTLTFSGTGNATYCYASIDGTKHTSAQSVSVEKGTTVTFGVYGYSSTCYGEVRVDGSQKLKVTNRSTQTYTWTADSDATIAMTYTSTSSRRNGRIVVTTS